MFQTTNQLPIGETRLRPATSSGVGPALATTSMEQKMTASESSIKSDHDLSWQYDIYVWFNVSNVVKTIIN